jgi:hypothetical protein
MRAHIVDGVKGSEVRRVARTGAARECAFAFDSHPLGRGRGGLHVGDASLVSSLLAPTTVALGSQELLPTGVKSLRRPSCSEPACVRRAFHTSRTSISSSPLLTCESIDEHGTFLIPMQTRQSYTSSRSGSMHVSCLPVRDARRKVLQSGTPRK